MDAATRLELLQAEYFKLQDMVETFDERALQIKAWSVTISLAGVVTAYGADGIDAVMKPMGSFCDHLLKKWTVQTRRHCGRSVTR